VAGTRCARIVRNFLELARKHPPERTPVILNDLVHESVELVAYALRVDDVEVHLDLDADVPTLWADRHQLQQVLVNLVTNAHHAMRGDTVRRLQIVTRHEVARAFVVLDVADSGPGIPDGLRERIFEPFFTTKPAGEGTGLGLSLCNGIVEAHGGTLTLAPGRSQGAVFRIELPVAGLVETRPEAQPTAARAGSGDENLLVVDDEPALVAMLAEMLSAAGYRVDTATSGAAALDKLASRPFDTVLTDVRMPGVDGPALYRQAAQIRGGSRPAFVFMTGDALTGQTARFLEETPAPCLRKPFALDDVLRVLAEAHAK
jgi:CheY-like chemotaxis protein